MPPLGETRVTIESLAKMVQEGFLDMGNHLTRVENRLSNVEGAVAGLQHEMAEVKRLLPTFTTTNMHNQLTTRVVVIERHLGI